MEQQLNQEDKELYALLDAALQDDRLTVSESLIQKTLQRAQEEQPAAMPKKRAAFRRYMPYAGVAAAAVFVLLLGSARMYGWGTSKSSDGAFLLPQESSDRYLGGMAGSGVQPEYGASDGYDKVFPASEGEALNKNPETPQTVQSNGTGVGADEGTDMADKSFTVESYLLSEDVYQALLDAGYPVVDRKALKWKKGADTVEWNEELTVLLEQGRFVVTSDVASEESIETYGKMVLHADDRVVSVLWLGMEDGWLFVVKKEAPEELQIFLDEVKNWLKTEDTTAP